MNLRKAGLQQGMKLVKLLGIERGILTRGHRAQPHGLPQTPSNSRLVDPQRHNRHNVNLTRISPQETLRSLFGLNPNQPLCRPC
jgi:hypothetical protein